MAPNLILDLRKSNAAAARTAPSMPEPTPRQAAIIIEAGKRVDDGAFEVEVADEPAFKILCDQICEHAWNLCRAASVEAAEALASGNSRHPSIAVAEMWQDACDAAWKVRGALRERREMRQATALPMSNFELGSANGAMGKSMSPQGPRGIQPGGWHRHPGAASSLVSQRRKGPSDADAERYMRGLYTDMPAPKLLVSDGSVCHEPMDVVKGLGMPTHDQRVWATRVEKIIKGARIEVDFRKSLYATLREHSGELPKFAREEIGRRALSLYRTSKHGSPIAKAFPQPGQKPQQPQQAQRPQKPPQKGAMPERIKIHPPGRDVPSSDDAANGKGARGAPQKSPGAVREQHFKDPGLDVADLAGGPTDNGVITAEIESLHKQLHALHAHMDGSPAQIHLHNDLVKKMREVYAKPDPEGLRHVKHMLHHFAEILQGPEEPDPATMMDDPQNPQMGGGPPGKGPLGKGPPGAGKSQPFARAKGPPQKGQKPPTMGKSLRPFEAGRFALTREAAFSESGEFEKGATHKYLRRIPTGKQKPKYRYIYNVNSAARAGGGGEAAPKVGEKVLVPHAGVRGHFEVREARSDGRVRAVHDESGQEIILHKHKFHDLIAHSHEEGLKAKHDAEDALPKNKLSAYRMMLQSSGIPDHDLAQADAAYAEWKSRGRASKSDKPKAWRGGELDGMRREIGGKKAKSLSSMAEAFEILSRSAHTWRDLKEKVLPAMRETPGFENIRLPMEAMTRHAFQDEERKTHDEDFRPENYGEAIGDAHEYEGGDDVEATFNPDEFARSLVENFTLLKAREHKYLRRIPTGKMKPKYRYVYSIASQAHDSVPSVGEKVRITDEGKEGHYEVKHVDGDEVHLEHDESHRKLVVRRGHLHDLFKHEHERALVAKHAELRRLAAQANITGTAGQQSLATANLRAFERTFGLQSQTPVPEAPASGQQTPVKAAASKAPPKPKRGWNEIADELRRTDKLVDTAVDSEARAVLIEKRAALTREQAALAAASGDHERAARMERLAKNDDENARGERAHTVYSDALKAAGDYSGKNAEEHAKLLDAVADAAEAWGHPRAMEKVEQYRRNAKLVRESAKPSGEPKRAEPKGSARGAWDGYKRPSKEELDALPAGTVLRQNDEDAPPMTKDETGLWKWGNQELFPEDILDPTNPDAATAQYRIETPSPAKSAPKVQDATVELAKKRYAEHENAAERASEKAKSEQSEKAHKDAAVAHETAMRVAKLAGMGAEAAQHERVAKFHRDTLSNREKLNEARAAKKLKESIATAERLGGMAARNGRANSPDEHEPMGALFDHHGVEADHDKLREGWKRGFDAAKKEETTEPPGEPPPKGNPAPPSEAVNVLGMVGHASPEAAQKLADATSKQREWAHGRHIWGSVKDRRDALALIQEGRIGDLSHEAAATLINKTSLMPAYDSAAARERGVSPGTAHLVQSLTALVAPKPADTKPETIDAYARGIRLLTASLQHVKTQADVQGVLDDLMVAVSVGRELGRFPSRAQAQEHAAKIGGDHIEVNSEYRDGATHYIVSDKNPATKEAILALGQRFATQTGLGTYTRGRFYATGPYGKQWGPSHGKIYGDAVKLAREADKKPGEEGWAHVGAQKAAENAARSKKAKEDRIPPWRRSVPDRPEVKGTKVEVKTGDRDRFGKTFNLGAVQRGEAISDKDLEHHLRHAEMAFHDMADVLGLEPKHVSINGRLGIAFGARGHGGALAHYETLTKAINLTRNAGAGSLAHEWGHFLDNILHETEASTKQPRAPFASESVSYLPPELGRAVQGVKDAMLKHPDQAAARAAWKAKKDELRAKLDASRTAFHGTTGEERQRLIDEHNAHVDEHNKHVRTSVGASDFLRDAEERDAGKSGKNAYWSSTREMWARAFESFVQDKLAEQGRFNSYLVAGTKGGPGQPYPEGEERKALSKAFDKFFEVVREGGHLKKAMRFVIDLQKSKRLRKSGTGEGSRGGHVIGHTAGGKPIYERHDDPTVIEYAKQHLFKGKSIAAAAKATAAKLHGGENMMLGPGVTHVDAKKLEHALTGALYEYASPKGEHMANSWMAQSHFKLSDKDMAKVAAHKGEAK